MALPPSIKPLSAAAMTIAFARHLIGEGGHAEALLHPEKNIEIGQGVFTITMPTPSAISSAIRAEPRYLAGSI
jgi:hypothetical protein